MQPAGRQLDTPELELCCDYLLFVWYDQDGGFVLFTQYTVEIRTLVR